MLYEGGVYNIFVASSTYKHRSMYSTNISTRLRLERLELMNTEEAADAYGEGGGDEIKDARLVSTSLAFVEKRLITFDIKMIQIRIKPTKCTPFMRNSRSIHVKCTTYNIYYM